MLEIIDRRERKRESWECWSRVGWAAGYIVCRPGVLRQPGAECYAGTEPNNSRDSLRILTRLFCIVCALCVTRATEYEKKTSSSAPNPPSPPPRVSI